MNRVMFFSKTILTHEKKNGKKYLDKSYTVVCTKKIYIKLYKK